ncbi:MAG: sarcosine oxidase subunit gamma family protein [Rhizobiaceae bacterium]|nr:sarcosine oxidase subunit gamma family protein [Rhizobiaceae bacterium]
MADRLSPLEPVYRPGNHGNLAGGAGVVLGERQPGSIVQLAVWSGQERPALAVMLDVTGMRLPDGAGSGSAREDIAAFGFAPGRFLLVSEAEGLADRLRAALSEELGTVTDLSHGRTAFRIAGAKAEWVLAKLFAIDFALAAFPTGAGRSTSHHDIFAQIQRSGPEQFDLYVFRSFARSFWHTLCRAAEETGYEVR